ncbi:MAG: MM0924 family protein [Pyrinomonadaceae bacterium]
MQELLARMVGQRLDVYCGGASSLRGEVLQVEGGVLHLKDDEGQVCYVAIERIIVVWAARDEDEHRAGFVPSQFK